MDISKYIQAIIQDIFGSVQFVHPSGRKIIVKHFDRSIDRTLPYICSSCFQYIPFTIIKTFRLYSEVFGCQGSLGFLTSHKHERINMQHRAQQRQSWSQIGIRTSMKRMDDHTEIISNSQSGRPGRSSHGVGRFGRA